MLGGCDVADIRHRLANEEFALISPIPKIMLSVPVATILAVYPVLPRTLRIKPGADAWRIAQAMVASDPSITTVALAPGRYGIAVPVVIKGAGRPIVWRGSARGRVVLDGGGVTKTALIVSGRDVTICGLELRRFTQNGILVTAADHITIADNHFVDVASTGWSQAAVHGLDTATNVTVARNVIEHTGYAGILFDGASGTDRSGLRVEGNTIVDTCRTKADCGAIYANDRGRRSRRTLIVDNVVRDFGPEANATKGIYLDDGLSGAIVRGNDVSGTGTYGIQIHGGSDNRIERNRFAASGRFLLYQSQPEVAARPMRGNVIRANRVSTLTVTSSGSDADRPDLSGNRLIR